MRYFAIVLVLAGMGMAQTNKEALSKDVFTNAKPVSSVPHLTDAQKLTVRNAQVELQRAYIAVSATKPFQDYQAALAGFNAAIEAAEKAENVDGKKWLLNDSLEFVPVEPVKEKQ